MDTVLPTSCSLQSSIIVAWTLSSNLPPISKWLGGQYPGLSIVISLQNYGCSMAENGVLVAYMYLAICISIASFSDSDV